MFEMPYMAHNLRPTKILHKSNQTVCTLGTFAHTQLKNVPLIAFYLNKCFLLLVHAGIAGSSHVSWNVFEVFLTKWKLKIEKMCTMILKQLNGVSSCISSIIRQKLTNLQGPLALLQQNGETTKIWNTAANSNYWPLQALFQVTVMYKTTVAA